MIGRLKGKICNISDDNVIVDINGVGYIVYLPQRILSSCVHGNEKTFLICTQVREDAIQLYGVENENELKLMQLLVRVNGISYKIACSIISEKTIPEFVDSILIGNLNGIKVSGVGTKLAERISIELKDKISSLSLTTDRDSTSNDKISNIASEAIMALKSLGYKEDICREVTSNILEKSHRNNVSTEEIVKQAINIISQMLK